MSATLVWRAVLAALLGITLSAPWLAAQSGGAPASTTTCNLEDGRQVYVRYNAVPSKEKPPNGKPWSPGGAPMTLFTEAQLTLGSSVIPIGAYTLYPIPAKDHWTLVVNKNVAAGAAYDAKQDISRSAQRAGWVYQYADSLQGASSDLGARCTLRIYACKSASFTDFTAK